MPKINQIQQKLRELDGGAFQKLADSYLFKKGYQQINPIGSAIGTNKVRKGTPDTLIPLPNGNYIFAEYSTTEEANIFGKFNGDIKKCFDFKKTGIPIRKIEEVVLCHTTEFSPEQLESLRVVCEKHGVNLNVFGIGAISYDLLEKYPGIARDYLAVEVDTGQIVDMNEFINLYSNNRLATRIDTAFHFRKEEIREIKAGMEENDLIIISGQAGVGKSRLALECCRKFIETNPSFKIRCIYNRGVDLFEDIRVYFSAADDFLILVDDANRISGFQYIVQLLQDKKVARQIKVIATVRDYALDKIKAICQPCGGAFERNILPFNDDQIKQLVEKEYGIKNQHYLDRIADISKGNPRLAIMASEIAVKENTLESIADVSALYDKYYESLRHDLEDLETDTIILKVAAIVSFFRSVDRSNKEIMSIIERVFGISENDFWEAARKLHGKEVFDMYENEAVKVSDQVLSTYLFYFVFFKKRIIDFGLILSQLFPHFRQRLVDAVNPVISAFNSHDIIERMRPAVDKAWVDFKNGRNEDDFRQLVEVFWLWKQTDTLLYVKEEIDAMEERPIDLANIKFESDTNTPYPTVIGILGAFKNAEAANFSIALNLLFDYVSKQQANVPQVLHCLIECFGFRPTSYLSGFRIQKDVIEHLWNLAKQGKDILFEKLFVAVADNYLHTHFSSTKSTKHLAITIAQFDLPHIPSLTELRRTIWFYLFQLEGIMREDVLNLLYKHPRAGFEISVKEIVKDDSAIVLNFLERNLDPSNIWHCFVVQGYLKMLSRFDITFSSELVKRFQSDTYRLYELLTSDRVQRRELEMELEEFEQYKKEKIGEHIRKYELSDYHNLFRQCAEIKSNLKEDYKIFRLSQGFATMLAALSEENPTLYVEVLRDYLEGKDFLNINSYLPVRCLVSVCGIADAYKVLSGPIYPSKKVWLFSYYYALPLEEVTFDHVEQLYALYKDAAVGEYAFDFDFLLKFRSIDNKIIVKIVGIILDKLKAEPKHASALSQLFNPYSEVNKGLMLIFSEDVGILEDAYLATDKVEAHADYDGHTFSRILDVDPTFAEKYIDEMYKRKEWLSKYDDYRDYSFIWNRDDYEQVMRRITERIFGHENSKGYFTYLEAFFGKERNWTSTSHMIERQDKFLKALILNRCDDLEFMKLLFSAIVGFPADRCSSHLILFLQHNKKFDDFKEIPLEPLIRSYSGSAVPMLQGKIDFYESLLAACNTVALLEHRQYIEQQIVNLRKEIQSEKKRDFTEDNGIALS